MERKTTHHLVPRSRCKGLGLNGGDRRNIRMISKGQHKAWHTLFGSKTPEEVILCILEQWFPSFAYYGEKVKTLELYQLYKRGRV